MSRFSVEPLPKDRVPAAATTLARAFVTNPLHIAVFGRGALDRNVAFFESVLGAMRGPMLVASGDAGIVGMIHWVEAPGCRLPMRVRLRLTPRLVRGVGVTSTIRLVSWTDTWARHDPRQPHVHLGPIGVAPECQGQGIGRALMDLYCAALEESGAVGYLETDRPENLEFYEKFGFRVVRELKIHGVPNYFMATGPRAGHTDLASHGSPG